MKDRCEYEKAVEIIGSAIRTWDPYCLIAEGAPIDEFDGQIAKITARIPGFHSPEGVAQALSDVFASSFGPDAFSAADCSAAAQQIFSELGRANLLPAA